LRDILVATAPTPVHENAPTDMFHFHLQDGLVRRLPTANRPAEAHILVHPLLGFMFYFSGRDILLVQRIVIFCDNTFFFNPHGGGH
jgi:hypothetical protein